MINNIYKSFKKIKVAGTGIIICVVALAIASCGSKGLGDVSSPDLQDTSTTGTKKPSTPSKPSSPDKQNPEAKFFTVTFDSDGGSSYPAMDVEEGGKALLPSGVFKTIPGLHKGPTGTFSPDGWYNGDTKWNFNNAINADITLIAKYPSPIDVSDRLGGNIVEKAVSYIKGSVVYDDGYTLVLDKNVDIAPQALKDNVIKLGIIGLGGVRTIGLSGDGALFTVGDNNKPLNKVDFTLGENITLRGKTGNIDAVVSINSSSATFRMQSGSKITGNTINISGNTAEKPINKAAAVEVINGIFIMEGGEISGNSSSKESKGYGFYATPSAVAIYKDGTFTMMGGSIYGNEGGVAEIAYNVNPNHGVFSLSGNARIKSVVMVYEGHLLWPERSIVIADWNMDFDKKIELNLSANTKGGGEDQISEVLSKFRDSKYPLLNVEALGDTGKDAIGRFQLEKYYNHITTGGADIPSSHYISTSGNNIGKLVR